MISLLIITNEKNAKVISEKQPFNLLNTALCVGHKGKKVHDLQLKKYSLILLGAMFEDSGHRALWVNMAVHSTTGRLSQK